LDKRVVRIKLDIHVFIVIHVVGIFQLFYYWYAEICRAKWTSVMW